MDVYVQLSGGAKRTINMRHVVTLGIQENTAGDDSDVVTYNVAIMMLGDTHVFGEPRLTIEEAENDLNLILNPVTWVRAYREG